MKKIIKIFLVLVAIFIIGFVFYAYKLHTLAVEGNKIFAKRCTEVNPPLISYKKSFLKMADIINNPEDYEPGSGTKHYEDYISGMREYLDKENEWLEEQRAYLDRQDFQLLEPWYIKDAALFQYKMYEGYRDEAKYMVAALDKGTMTEDLSKKYDEAKDRRIRYESKYFEFFEKARQIRDWRKFLGQVPPPEECTPENTTIPSTEGSIDWDGDQTPTPSPIPVDPNFVS